MKYGAVKSTFVAFGLATLAGCASINPLNSPEQVQRLITAFNASCIKAGGKVSAPERKGAEAACVKDENKADMFVYAAFIFIELPLKAEQLENAQGVLSKMCNTKGGNYTLPYRMIRTRLVSLPNRKATCKVGDTWLGQAQLAEGGMATLNAGVQRIPRGAQSEGSVYMEDLDAALILTLANQAH